MEKTLVKDDRVELDAKIDRIKQLTVVLTILAVTRSLERENLTEL